MRLLFRFISVVSALAGSSVTLCTDGAEDITTIVDSVGQHAVETENVVGLSIGVARGDTILCVRGFGHSNAELNVPATADTVYRIGSITKEFTAAAVLLLIEDGKISFDDPLSKFLPEYPTPGCDVTVRHLLQHTSGVKDFTRLPAYRKELRIDVTQDEVLSRFQDLPLNSEPGKKHQYCNSGYFLLGMVIEQASGESYADFVQDRVFHALELKHTYCDGPSRIIPDRAAGYTRWRGVLRNAPYISLTQTVGAGNLASTVSDLLTWQHGLVSERLLKPASTQLLITRGVRNNGKAFNYGMGVFVRKIGDHDVIRHGGGISGFRADVAYHIATGHTIAVLANSENANAARISDRIAKRLFAKSTDEKSQPDDDSSDD
ncbi:MAG: serine hydrolase domain-containing protein [Fuerstiella sp.]